MNQPCLALTLLAGMQRRLIKVIEEVKEKKTTAQSLRKPCWAVCAACRLFSIKSD